MVSTSSTVSKLTRAMPIDRQYWYAPKKLNWEEYGDSWLNR
jgi:hypothetical protein